MKTKGLRNLILVSAIASTFYSCQEDEFYEKEYIETLKEQYEKEHLPDDIAEAEFDDLANDLNNPDNISSDDGSVITEPDSTADTGSDSTTDDSSSADSSSSDDSTSTDSSDTVVDGGSDDSSSTDDSTSTDSSDTVADGGSDDSSSPDDSTSSDTSDTVEDGSSDDSSSTDDSTSEPVQESKDIFTYSPNGNKIDILWVIDNSGSMGDEQKALGENFESFIKEFVENDIDFQMAVTTTDTSKNNAGREYKNSMSLLNAAKLAEDKEQFLADFAELVKVGIDGFGLEKGIKASEVFTDRFQNRWMRDEAYFAIVYVSDEEDQSEKSVANHLKQIAKWKNNIGLIKAYSIVDMVPSSTVGAISRGYERYNEMSEITGGSVASIKGNFQDTLLEMGAVVADLAMQFSLSSTPEDISSIEVIVDGEVIDAWEYDLETNSVKLLYPETVQANAQIQVKYLSK